MIITDDGYSLLYERRKNKITVRLPQTVYTLTDTYALTDTANAVADRKIDVPEGDLAVLLTVVRLLFRKEEAK